MRIALPPFHRTWETIWIWIEYQSQNHLSLTHAFEFVMFCVMFYTLNSSPLFQFGFRRIANMARNNSHYLTVAIASSLQLLWPFILRVSLRSQVFSALTLKYIRVTHHSDTTETR